MLGQTCWLILLTQSWPSFNAKVGGHSYWLLFGLNVAAGVSCVLSRVIHCSEYFLLILILVMLIRGLGICLLYPPRNKRCIIGTNGEDFR
jgi:hypothetical protein